MKRLSLLNPRVSILMFVGGLALMASVAAALTVGAGEEPDKSLRPPPPTLDDFSVVVREGVTPPPAPPREMVLVDKNGFIRKPQWDDRRLSDAEKAANPTVNPRWAPFARCMVAEGPATGVSPSTFAQRDLDVIVDRLNAAGPLVQLTAGTLVVRREAELDAYVRCAFAILLLPSEDLYKVLTPAELAAAQGAGFAPSDSPPAQLR